jgi:hypothetical protein
MDTANFTFSLIFIKKESILLKYSLLQIIRHPKVLAVVMMTRVAHIVQDVKVNNTWNQSW